MKTDYFEEGKKVGQHLWECEPRLKAEDLEEFIRGVLVQGTECIQEAGKEESDAG